jgi:hypothetical protein
MDVSNVGRLLFRTQIQKANILVFSRYGRDARLIHAFGNYQRFQLLEDTELARLFRRKIR